MPQDPRDLVARLRPRLICGMAAANVVGGIVVYVFMRWILPLPPVSDPDAASREKRARSSGGAEGSCPTGGDSDEVTFTSSPP